MRWRTITSSHSPNSKLRAKQAEFWLAAYAYEKGDDDDLLAISAKLAETPCSPLYKGPVSPDKALHELVKAGAQI